MTKSSKQPRQKPNLRLVAKPKNPAPTGLSPEAQAFYTGLADEYSVIDAGGITVLTAAAQDYDRMLQARALIAIDGMTTIDRFGQSRVHPAVLIERDSRAAMLRALKMLNLDLEPLHGRVGKPDGSRW